MADYRITVKVRNARILEEIKKSGHRPGEKFAKLIGLSYKIFLDYIDCKRGPFDEDENLRPCAEKFCIFFNKLPNDLWSSKQRTPLPKSKVEQDIDEVSIEAFLTAPSEKPGLLENMVQVETIKAISEVIDSLPKQKAEVVRLLYGIGCKEQTVQEIADSLGVSRSRIDQINRSALRSLRHPSRGVIDIVDDMYPLSSRISDAAHLFALQSHLNNGRGLWSIQCIHAHLQDEQSERTPYWIKRHISNEWHEIKKHPSICQQLNKLGLLEQIRYDSLYQRNEKIRLQSGVYVEIYDKLQKLFSEEIRRLDIVEVFELTEAGIAAIASESSNSLKIQEFNRRMNSLQLDNRQIEIVKTAIAEIIKEADAAMFQISTLS